MSRAPIAAVLIAGGMALLAPVAAAAPIVQSLGASIVGSPSLGVSGSGEAVLAWSGTTTVFTSVRAAGGVFGAPRHAATGRLAARSFALAVGRRGDAVLAWRSGGRTRPVLTRIRRPGAAFGRARAVPGSAGGRGLAAAVSPHGTVLVAWLARASSGCGGVVLASISRPGRSFGPARRVSGRCSNPAALRAAMSATDDGVVVWRATDASGAYAMQAAVVGRHRVGVVRRVSRGPVVAFGAEVAGTATGALLVWRDRASADRTGATGRVLEADVSAPRATAPEAMSLGDRIVGIPRVAARPDGAALVAWEEFVGTPTPGVLAAGRPASAATFAAPALVDPCGAADASRTYATPALDARGSAGAVFQSACMARFGLGPEYGIAVARRPEGAAWQPAQPLSHGTYAVGAVAGAADDGEVVLAWVEQGPLGGLRAVALSA